MRRTVPSILALALAACVHPQDPPGTAPPGPGEPAPGELAGEGEPGAPPEPGARPADPAAGDAPAEGEQPAILVAHNRLRAKHCAGPLSWSRELVDESHQWAASLAAHGCAFEHNPGTQHGENLSYFRPEGALGEEDIADQWYREIDRYDFRHPGFSFEAGHFTQLVWAGTQRLGCSSARCGGGELWVCNYDPPGNVEGQFDSQVHAGPCR